nr:flagellin [Marasmitruncus massiliensis]
MVVRSNIMALNANRQLGMNNTQVSKSLEKLSSGFKINRAGDDASGLAISEKMKAQIKGLETASANSQDGISLVQTAEGALTEVHSMLNRMVELATKSANGTLQDDVDRDAIQSEIDALTSEIDRIGDSTNFNGINLLDGSLSGGSATSVAITGTLAGTPIAGSDVAAAAQIYETGAVTQTNTDGSKAATVTVVYTDASGTTKTKDVNFDSDTAAADTADAIIAAINADSELSALFTAGGDNTGITLESNTAGTKAAMVTGLFVKAAGEDVVAVAAGEVDTPAQDAGTSYDLSAAIQAGDSVTINGKVYTAKVGSDGTDGKTFADWASLVAAAAKNGVELKDISGSDDGSQAMASEKGGLTLQIGDTSDTFNKMTVSVEDMRSAGLGISGLDVSTADAAASAINTIKDAINKVSTNRADMGALQNRLEYTINNLDVSAENLTSANSRIRDTDMAKEMMNYTKMNVLTQAAQAMLAQANQQPQSILQLLQ